MLTKKIIKYLLVLVSIFIVTFIFFTEIYLNIFKNSFQYRISNTLDLNRFEYDKIKGNFIKGFKIFNLKIESDNYTYVASEFNVTLDISISYL